MNENTTPFPIGENQPATSTGKGSFQVQMLADFQCILRREQEDWKLAFPSVAEAFEFAKHEPGGDEAQVSVVDKTGVRFAKIVLR